MKNNKAITIVHITVFLICTTLIFISAFIKKEWGQVSIEQILFNINTPLELGEELKHSILRAARQIGTIYIVCASFYIFLIIKIRNFSFYKWISIAICFFPFLTVLYLNHEYNIIKFIKDYRASSMFIEENYTVDRLGVTWKQKKNLVLIIAESLENTYADPSIFNPPVIPQLKKLQQENVSFGDHIATPGTGWTIAGVTSYFFGIPFKVPFGGNDYGAAEHFLPDATSIIEIMEDAGYTTTFISGWDTVFSGYNKLISTHSRGENLDQAFFGKQGNSWEEFAGAWGFSDSFIFSEARKIFAISLAQKKPFALIITTIDTHPPSGFSEEKFKKYNDIRDAYLSLDDQIYRFVQDIRVMDDENTSIIIIGDHLSMQNDIADKYLAPNNDKRTIYNCFINSVQSQFQPQKSRLFGSVDMAPTILEAIGCELPNGRFGLGVSLFSNNPTLLEQNKDRYFEEISKRSELYEQFFTY